MRNENMEMWADKVRSHFPPPKYRVELKAFETQLWVVDEDSHHAAEFTDEDLLLVSEPDLYQSIREYLA